MADDDHSEHERRIELLIRRLPASFQPRIRRLRRPEARWVRLIAAILLILGGFLWFLPILGLWMLPLGLLLIAQDVPFLQKPLASMLGWIERKWMERRRARDAH